MKYYELNYDDEIYNVCLVREAYAQNNSLAIELITDEGEPFCSLTVNLPDTKIWGNDHTAFVDTNNCPWAEEFIEANELGEPVGYIARSGFCAYPLYVFNLDKIDE